MIVSLHEKRWAVCLVGSGGTVNLTVGLQRASVSGAGSLDMDKDVCSTFFTAAFGGKICEKGQSSRGLGITAAVMMGLVLASGAAILTTSKHGIARNVAFAAHLFGGLLAIVAGSAYAIQSTSADVQCESMAAGRSLIIGGHKRSTQADEARSKRTSGNAKHAEIAHVAHAGSCVCVCMCVLVAQVAWCPSCPHVCTPTAAGPLNLLWARRACVK